MQPAVRASAQVLVRPNPPTAEPNTIGVEKPQWSTPVAPRLEAPPTVIVLPTVDVFVGHMGERDSDPIPNPGSFPSLKQAHAKPAPKAPVAKETVVTDQEGGFTEVTGSKKGKGKAKFVNIDKINNAWSSGPAKGPRSIPNVDKNSIVHAIKASVSLAATNIQGFDHMRLILNMKGAKVTEKDRMALNPTAVDEHIHKACTSVPNMSRICMARSSWNRLGNLVISFHKGTDISRFFMQEDQFKKALALPFPATFKRDVPVSQININSVPTGLGIFGREEKPCSQAQILQEVCMALHRIVDAKVRIIQGPRWLLTRPLHSNRWSLMIAFEDQGAEIVTALLKNLKNRVMFWWSSLDCAI